MSHILVVTIFLLSLILNHHETFAKPLVGHDQPSANELLDSQLQVWSNLEELASRMVGLINQSTIIDQLINKEESARSKQGEETFRQLPRPLGYTNLRPVPSKRYLGIDIPDYISTGGKIDALKHMSDKMKAMG